MEKRFVKFGDFSMFTIHDSMSVIHDYRVLFRKKIIGKHGFTSPWLRESLVAVFASNGSKLSDPDQETWCMVAVQGTRQCGLAVQGTRQCRLAVQSIWQCGWAVQGTMVAIQVGPDPDQGLTFQQIVVFLHSVQLMSLSSSRR